MVLSALSLEVRYDRIIRLLKTGYAGTSFGNLALLESIGVQVELGRGDDFNNIALLTETLELNCPLIVAVETSELKTYWRYATSHAIVVIGINDEDVIVNDPAFEDAPKFVPINEFLIAWGEQDYSYAVITKK